MMWMLWFGFGCTEFFSDEGRLVTGGSEAASPTLEDSPPPSSKAPETDATVPTFQAHGIVLPVDADGAVTLDDVEWTLSMADAAAEEICSAPVTILAIENVELAPDEEQILAAWTFEIEAPDDYLCTIEAPDVVEIAIGRPDSRLAPVMAPIEDFANRELYSYVIQLGSTAIPTLHGVATTPELLSGGEFPVESAPLPAGTYSLEPLLYLGLP